MLSLFKVHESRKTKLIFSSCLLEQHTKSLCPNDTNSLRVQKIKKRLNSKVLIKIPIMTLETFGKCVKKSTKRLTEA